MAKRFADCLEEPLLRQGFNYWARLRQGRRAPARRDIDPAEIPNLLPHVMLTDVLHDGRGRHRYRFRLAGTEVEQAFGRPMTGWHVDELLAGGYRAYVTGLYDEVVRRCTPVFSRSGYRGGDAALEALRLMMPLSSDGGAGRHGIQSPGIPLPGPCDGRPWHGRIAGPVPPCGSGRGGRLCGRPRHPGVKHRRTPAGGLTPRGASAQL